MGDEAQQSGSTIRCEACGMGVLAYDIVRYGSMEQGYRDLCTSCLNAEMGNALGLEDFENVHLHPVVITDCAGERHGFHFRLRLLGSMLMLDAFELTNGGPGGYQFQILGKPDDEPLSLLGSLIARMRRSLSVKHLERSTHGLQIADQTYAGGSTGMRPRTVACQCS